MVGAILFSLRDEAAQTKWGVRKNLFNLQQKFIESSGSFLRLSGEELIRLKGDQVAQQISTYLTNHPDMKLSDLRENDEFSLIAVQPVGKTGATSVYEAETKISRFNNNPKLIDVSLITWGQPFPDFLKIIESTNKGVAKGGLYKSLDDRGALREKYMWLAPVAHPTADGIHLMVLSTALMQDFLQPIKQLYVSLSSQVEEISKKINDTNRMAQNRTFGIIFVFIIFTVSITLMALQLFYGYERISEEVKERKVVEAQLKVANRLLVVLGEINLAVIRFKDQESLFKSMCKISVEVGGFRMAWIGLNDEKNNRVQPVSSFGGDKGFLQDVSSDSGVNLVEGGSFQKAFNEKRIVTIRDTQEDGVRDLWCAKALKFGYRSFVVIPFACKGKIIGILSIFSEKTDSFSKEDEWLFQEISKNISFALEAMEESVVRREVEEALRGSEEQFQYFALNLPGIAYKMKRSPEGKYSFSYVSKGSEKLFGVSPEDAMKDVSLIFAKVHPEDFNKLLKSMEESAIQKARWNCEFRYLLSSDETKWIYGSSLPVLQEDASILWNGILLDISEQKKAQDGLKEKEQAISSIVENSAIATFVIDPNHKVLYWNKACEEISQWKAKDMVGTNNHGKAFYGANRPCLSDMIVDGNFDELNNLYRIHDKSKSVPGGLHAEGWYQLGGKDKYVLLDAAPIYGPDKKLFAVIETTQDITQHKMVESKLLENEQRLQMAEKMARIGHWYFDVKNNALMWSDTMYEIFGVTKTNFIVSFEKFMDLVHPDDRAAADRIIEKAKKDGQAEFEYRIRRKDGKVRYIRGITQTLSPGMDESDILFGIVADVTEQKQMEDQLKESESRYRMLAENITDTIWLTDLNLRFQYVSPSVKKMIGYAPEEVSRMTMDQVLIPSSFEFADKVLTNELASEGTPGKDLSVIKTLELEHRRKDGSTIWVEVTVRFLRDKTGKITHLLGVSRDITERKAVEVQLKNSFEKLQNVIGGVINVIASTVESRDPYTAGHQRRVSDLACAIAKKMNLTAKQVDGVRMAGLIHDLGKISIPAEILTLPRELTEHEYGLVKFHPESGYAILKNIDFPWPIGEIIYEHHERLDGSGYPRGLKGDQILLEAKIIAVADVVESMVSYRPYRAALGLDVALNEIVSKKGVFYDPAVVEACVKVFKEDGYKIEGFGEPPFLFS
jgi:PAS domain S-box-containing protein